MHCITQRKQHYINQKKDVKKCINFPEGKIKKKRERERDIKIWFLREGKVEREGEREKDREIKKERKRMR